MKRPLTLPASGPVTFGPATRMFYEGGAMPNTDDAEATVDADTILTDSSQEML